MACGTRAGHIVDLIRIAVASDVGIRSGKYGIRIVDTDHGGIALLSYMSVSIWRWRVAGVILQQGVVCKHVAFKLSMCLSLNYRVFIFSSLRCLLQMSSCFAVHSSASLSLSHQKSDTSIFSFYLFLS